MISYDQEIDKANIKRFRTPKDKRDEGQFKCVVCKHNTTIGSSFSNQGHKLICRMCVKERFPTVIDAMDWCVKIDL